MLNYFSINKFNISVKIDFIKGQNPFKINLVAAMKRVEGRCLKPKTQFPSIVI